MSDPEVGRLPHWARVAFAARCGRVGLALFRVGWPAVPADRLTAVVTAVELAEQSAASGRPAAGLAEAALGALISAGAALMKTTPNPPPRPAPASLAAKPAEFAAKAAAAGPEASAERASQAYEFALDAARQAEDFDAADGLEADLARLRWAAAAGGWHDQTPVPPTTFGPL